MIALSIRQPWAWLIVNGYKDVENRDWRSAFRGELYIHAGLKFEKADYAFICCQNPEIMMPLPADFKRGGIVGVAEMHGCVTDSDSDWFMGEYGFLMRDARPVDFKPCKGALGFFKPEFKASL